MHYAFDLEFQKCIIASFLSDKQFFTANFDILQPEFFNDDVLQGIVEAVREFYLKEKEIPNKEALTHEIRKIVAPGRSPAEYADGVVEVFNLFGHNTAYYQQKAVEFARTHLVSNALERGIELLKQGEIDEIESVIKKAVKAGQEIGGNNGGFYDFFEKIKERAKEYFSNKTDPDRLATGISPLDERIRGGLGKGESGLLIAPPKHGKTAVLISLAANALFLDKRVLYVTLELSKKVISERFDSNIFGMGLDDIKKKARQFYNKMSEVRNKVRGSLTIVEFPTYNLSIPQLRALIDKAKPEIVFVDYLALVRAPKSRGERRYELSDLNYEFRGLAGEFQIPMWTAHPSNRPGMGVRSIGLEHIAEDFNLGAIHDVLVSVNQTFEEEKAKLLRLHIMGNRLGPSGDSIQCNVNWETSKISAAFGKNDSDFN